MSNTLDWIKDIVAVSTADKLDEDMRKDFYKQLEATYKSFSDEEKHAVRNMLAQFENNDIIFVLSCINEYMDVEEFKEMVLDCIIKGNFNWRDGAMLELQTSHINGYYEKKRVIRRQNIECLNKLLHLEYPYIKVRDRNRKRIAIMTETILSLLHAPTSIVMNYAYVLQEKMGYEVMLFACPSNAYLPKELWHDTFRMNSLSELNDRALIIQYNDVDFIGYQIDMNGNSLKEYSMMYSIMYYWNPLFVFQLGVHNPVMDLATKFTTVVTQPMSIGCPVSEGQILIRPGRQDDIIEQSYKESIGDKQKQLFIEEKWPIVVEKSSKKYTRLELGLPEDQFLIVIVGNR